MTNQPPMALGPIRQQPSRDRVGQPRHVDAPDNQALGMLVLAVHQMRHRLAQLTLQLEHV